MNEIPAELTLMNLRTKAGLTRRELAEAVGVTEKTIYVWETSTKEPKMTPSQIKSYIDTVECSFDEFVKALQRSNN